LQCSWMLLLLIGCGGDKDESASGGVLAAALDEARASTAAFCDVADECYPGEVEEHWCNTPDGTGVSGLTRDWLPIVADRCWDPLYAARPEAVLALLKCAREAHDAFSACLASCPDGTHVGTCWNAYHAASDGCYPPFERDLGEARIEDYEACTDRLAPPPE
jgi:hypothetical protein